MNNSLGDRMKAYEGVTQTKLTRRTPVILRVDGKAFHTYTKQWKFQSPFSTPFYTGMQSVAVELMQGIQGAKLVYGQSDEISLLLTDYDTLYTEPWFGYKVQKIVSVAASIATAAMNSVHPGGALALFDARVFNLPKEEVVNYFVWRQKDAERNSINALAQSHFSHKELQGIGVAEVHEKLHHERSVNWNDVPTKFKRGWCITNGNLLNEEIPIFTEDRAYIEDFMNVEDI